MVYAEFGGQTECIMGNWKIENNDFTNTFLAAQMRSLALAGSPEF